MDGLDVVRSLVVGLCENNEVHIDEPSHPRNGEPFGRVVRFCSFSQIGPGSILGATLPPVLLEYTIF